MMTEATASSPLVLSPTPPRAPLPSSQDRGNKWWSQERQLTRVSTRFDI
jgi:hypothetical protein